jgi:hypothetical protein
MNKVTYLLGAGASCNALPMVKNFVEKILAFKNKVLTPAVERAYRGQGGTLPKNHVLFPRGDFAKSLIQSLEWLGKEAQRHASVDTYAKKLFIRNDEKAQRELSKLKATLSCYLLLEQSLNPVDKRYDSFFASILTSKSPAIPLFPEAINIVNWNYDTQLEKSFKEFCEDLDYVYEVITNAPNIIRLNGLCGMPDKPEMRNLCYADFNDNFFQSVMDLYEGHLRAPDYHPRISFAWERGGQATETT